MPRVETFRNFTASQLNEILMYTFLRYQSFPYTKLVVACVHIKGQILLLTLILSWWGNNNICGSDNDGTCSNDDKEHAVNDDMMCFTLLKIAMTLSISQKDV